MTIATIYDPSDRDLTEAAKLITKALNAKRKAGQLTWAERLSVCRELLSAPNFREPLVSEMSERLHQEREFRVHG